KVRKMVVADIRSECIIGMDLLHSLGNSIFDLKRKNTGNSSDSSTDDSTSDSESSGDELINTVMRNNNSHTRNTCKLPPFTGKERWEVWFNRFEEVAKRNGWDNNEKLDELLPRLQGDAGEFCFGQLSKKTRKNYSKLVTELDARFKVIEVPKTFQSQFSNRQQRPGEQVETFATDLKKIYDKAYPNRPAVIR
ncbi:MAG: hypothetical protein GY786_18125, partial [Proteobacteria bacterium]|nr:hypothetical protein [Pseudomonadota bacterium]